MIHDQPNEPSDIEDAILLVIRDQLHESYVNVSSAVVDLKSAGVAKGLIIPGNWALKIICGDGSDGIVSAKGDWAWVDGGDLVVVKIIKNQQGLVGGIPESRERLQIPIGDPKLFEKVIEFLGMFHGYRPRI